MTNAQKELIAYIGTLEGKPGVDQVTVQAFINRAKADHRLTRDEGPVDHFCSFFVPVNRETRSVFIGHHVKAGSWIPPGGHMDRGEMPLQTVDRELKEELDYTLTDEQIELIDLSIIYIENKRTECKFHYDFWHVVYMPRKDMTADPHEFYESSWYPIDEAVGKVTNPTYGPGMAKIRDLLSTIG